MKIKNTATRDISCGNYNWIDNTNPVTTIIKLPKPAKIAPSKTVSDADNRKTLDATGGEVNATENTLDNVKDMLRS